MISSSDIEQLRKVFESDAHQKVLQNIISKNDITNLRVNRDREQKNPHFFSIKPEPNVKITNQKSSGRCWEFAAHNVIRRTMIKRYNLSTDWEFSQSYFFFWDKFERLNFNLQRIIETAGHSVDSRLVQCLLADPTCDGGQWDMFVNIIKKHGMVPKTVFSESHHSSQSRKLNDLLKSFFRKVAAEVRDIINNGEELLQIKTNEFRNQVFQILCKFLGTPPQSFVWEYYDKDNKYNKFEEMTPQDFYGNVVPFNCDDYVCFINDPRNKFYHHFTVEHLGNVEGGRPVSYFNVPLKDMKEMVLNSLKNGEVVWFGCDVGKDLNGVTMDDQLDQTKELMGMEVRSSSKAERLLYGDSLMTHAMVITACNEDPTRVYNNEHPVSFYQVENSWGCEGNRKETGGYYCMSDSWFSKWVYEIVVNKEYISQNLKNIYMEPTTSPTVLPFWDPMGSLAFNK